MTVKTANSKPAQCGKGTKAQGTKKTLPLRFKKTRTRRG
jgi:hypothetical protein